MSKNVTPDQQRELSPEFWLWALPLQLLPVWQPYLPGHHIASLRSIASLPCLTKRLYHCLILLCLTSFPVSLDFSFGLPFCLLGLPPCVSTSPLAFADTEFGLWNCFNKPCIWILLRLPPQLHYRILCRQWIQRRFLSSKQLSLGRASCWKITRNNSTNCNPQTTI